MIIIFDIGAAWALCVIALELLTGFALIGIAGDEMLVDLRKRPTQYWFSISIQVFILVVYVTGRIAFFLS